MVFAALSVFASGSFARPNEPLFTAAVGAFQKGDFKQARTSFTEILKTDPADPVVLYNLGLTEEKLGKIGMALGLWRKALAVNPEYSAPRRAIEWSRGKLERAQISHDVELWESFRATVLTRFSLETFLLATATALLAGGWLFLRYLGARRSSILDEKPLPAFPMTATFVSTAFFFLVFLSVAKAFDMQVVRATIIEKKVEARSSPDPEGTPLFNLYEGLEVIVRQEAKDWVQVSYPGASTGWIPQTAVFATTAQVVP